MFTDELKADQQVISDVEQFLERETFYQQRKEKEKGRRMRFAG